jgi:uncharacterized protein (DUF934 family)
MGKRLEFKIIIKIGKFTMKLIAAQATNTPATPENSPENGVLVIGNDANPLESNLNGIKRIDLHFPKFTDGRAFSQAVMLRKRAGFTGEIRATGDVLVDQLQQMARSGFDVAELRADQDLAAGQRQLDRYAEFYQADVVQKAPHFAKVAA